ncbi:Bifunctional riboflavin biosynthesis protein RIBA 1, chloroplastic [Stylosanthes scabra]|uniref:Bifunctional riboflavin biosynthesis protein RIBA 1, chloroplastic n=1 Tax=Stylosanthes scabra TaxID=79078 RepID=A0ABU6Q456_9FABA|nr:Bifunctional riboflavin biosynthesis protein RIBA 1, chloroplastic [Stylosanthes scabra]
MKSWDCLLTQESMELAHRNILKMCLQILRDLGVRSMKLMTNNPAKYVGLKGYGLTISGRIPLVALITKENKRYLETKRVKMGHVYGLKSNSELNPDSGNGKPGVDDSKDATTL